MEKNKNYVKQIFKIDVGNIPENEVEDYVRRVADEFKSGISTDYLETIPNSHYWSDLNEIVNYFQIKPDDLTPEFLRIGFNNSKNYGFELKRIRKTIIKYPIVSWTIRGILTIDDIINYIDSDKFNLSELCDTLINYLDAGYNLTKAIMMERQEVYNHIDGERDYQDLNWGSRMQMDGISDEEKPVAEWINYIEYHMSRAKNCVYHLDTNGATDELRKIAALAVRAMEIHGCPERVVKVDTAPNCCSPNCECKKSK